MASLHCKGGLNQRGTAEMGLAGGVDLSQFGCIQILLIGVGCIMTGGI